MSDLTPKQTLLLWTLLAGGGQAERKVLKPVADAEALLGAGLVATGYKGSGKTAWVEVTDRGWAWAPAHLGDELPKGHAPLRAWLGRLAAFLARSGTPLADLFTPAPEPLNPRPVKPPPKPRAPPKATVPRPATAKQLRARIAKAYAEVTGKRKGVRVPLSDLRARLPDIDRATLDEALSSLHETDPKMSLMHLDDPRRITDAIRDAQVMFKGEPLQLLWIDP